MISHIVLLAGHKNKATLQGTEINKNHLKTIMEHQKNYTKYVQRNITHTHTHTPEISRYLSVHYESY